MKRVEGRKRGTTLADPFPPLYSQVQSGGSFDIDWVVTNPSDTIVIEGERERQGDFIFTADAVGEYSFCFSNDMSSFSEKLVDFDIMVESEPRPVAPAKPTALTEQTSSLEESIYKLSGSLSSIQRTQKYFRTRENRNVRSPFPSFSSSPFLPNRFALPLPQVSTVKSTEWRIFSFSLAESALMVGMSAFQVWGPSSSSLFSLFSMGPKTDCRSLLLQSFNGSSRVLPVGGKCSEGVCDRGGRRNRRVRTQTAEVERVERTENGKIRALLELSRAGLGTLLCVRSDQRRGESWQSVDSRECRPTCPSSFASLHFR